jgi:hypothetical protein
MPNHVTNRLTVIGHKKGVEYMAEMIVDEGKGAVDFEILDPMPEICSSVTTGSCTIDGERVTRWIEDEHGNKRKLEALEEVSLRASGGDWYTWAISHWGTKWNAYDSSVICGPSSESGKHTLVCTFHTAWACPMPWFEKLAARAIEGITLTLEWADEDFGQNTGYAIKNAMGLEIEELPGGTDLAMDHAADILGYDPREDEDWLDADAEDAEWALEESDRLADELAGKSTDKAEDNPDHPPGPAADWVDPHDWETEVYN